MDLAVLTGELPLIDPATGRLADREPAGAGVGRHDDGAPGFGAPSGGGSVAVRQRVQPRRVALDRPQTPLPRIILLALSVSLVNPHAILDTVVMMGTFAQTFGAAKWAYVGGAVAASLVWFTALGWGGTKLAPSMDSARTWRIVDAVVGVLMLGIAVKVGLTLL
jgi:L-lysine exporter family protein LysE/ArgO